MAMLSQLDKDHADMVKALVKPGQEVINGLDPRLANLLHMAVGVAGEAGELLDQIKKASIYGKPVDVKNVIEELGDLEFYMQGIRAELELTRNMVLTANMVKLGTRYPGFQYTNEAAIRRADKPNGG